MPRPYKRWTPELKEGMREMRRKGASMPAIAEEYGAALQTVSDAVKDIPLLRKQPTKKQTIKMRKDAKRQMEYDRVRNKVLPNTQHDTVPRVTTMPSSTTGINIIAPPVDPSLVTHARAMLETWTTDTAQGRLLTLTNTERAKAAIVLAHSYEVHNWEVFASDRPQWYGIRQLAGVSAEVIAERVGISFASVSRYETREGKASKRNPDPTVARRLHLAYTAIQEQAIAQQELILTVASYVHAHEMDDDEPFDTDDLYAWIGQGNDLDTASIAHIKYLAEIRRLIPFPAWREPTPTNLWLMGYPTIRATV